MRMLQGGATRGPALAHILYYQTYPLKSQVLNLTLFVKLIILRCVNLRTPGAHPRSPYGLESPNFFPVANNLTKKGGGQQV